MSLLVLESVRVLYGSRLALDGFDLSVQKGERVVLLGPSGCGKTTVLRVLSGLVTPEEGRVFINGQKAAADGKTIMEPEGRGLGMVFQDLALWPHLSVAGNLELGLRAGGIGKRERQRRIQSMLEMVELQDLAALRPGELSGGQQQRVALARALVGRPRALLMDEPFSSLDSELNRRLCGEIIQLQKELSFTLVHVTHNREEAESMATRMVRMDQGRIL